MPRRHREPKPEPTPYQKKLMDPRWQKKRLEILERDGWMCQRCDSKEKTLNVHHRFYMNDREPWEVPGDVLETLCEQCHEDESTHRRNAEKFLCATMGYLGVPWWSLHELAENLLKNFPPLPVEEAHVIMTYIAKSLPFIVQHTGIGSGFAEFVPTAHPEDTVDPD